MIVTLCGENPGGSPAELALHILVGDHPTSREICQPLIQMGTLLSGETRLGTILSEV
jgi:hypothetical protein